jgi:hypothetical protein
LEVFIIDNSGNFFIRFTNTQGRNFIKCVIL